MHKSLLYQIYFNLKYYHNLNNFKQLSFKIEIRKISNDKNVH